MTPLQLTFWLCFVAYPLVVIVQALWIVWLVWFSGCGLANGHQPSLHTPQRRTRHSRRLARPSTLTPVQATVEGTAAELPARRAEVTVP